MRLLIHISLTCALFPGALLHGANSTLSLGNGSGTRGQNVSLPLAFVASGNQTSSLEWDLTYSTADFSAISVSVGPAATAAAKSLVCASPSAGRYNCVLFGLNRTLLSDGVVATATLTVSGSATNNSSSVSLAPGSSTGIGSVNPINGNAGTVAIGQPGSLSGLTCSPVVISPPASITCTVSLAAAAPSGGTTVALGYVSSSATMTLPASTLVSAGATQKSFSVQAVSTNSSTTARITATLNGTTKSFTLYIWRR
jgi:trimeric autotransporter adhesin